MKTVIVLLLTLLSWSANAANQALCDEITTDPLGRGYSGMNPQQIAVDLNTKYRLVFYDRVNGADLFEGIEVADWQLRSEAEKTQIIALLSFGEINPQGKVRSLLQNIFGGGSTTIANMANIARHYISRTEELGLGRVNQGEVERACN